MKYFTVILVLVCLSLSVYIGYTEIIDHDHNVIPFVNHGDQAHSGLEDLQALSEIMSHAEGEPFTLPIQETTDMIHALSDLSKAMAPMLTPFVVYYVHKKTGKAIESGQRVGAHTLDTSQVN